MPRKKAKNAAISDKAAESATKADCTESNTVELPPVVASLILTSEKKRGVYECDCCRVDISQAPRIQCAVCVDYDICLDCFIKDDSSSSSFTSSAVGPRRHKPTLHGYRVADSTRFPLFPSLRGVVSATTSRTSTAMINLKRLPLSIPNPVGKSIHDLSAVSSQENVPALDTDAVLRNKNDGNKTSPMDIVQDTQVDSLVSIEEREAPMDDNDDQNVKSKSHVEDDANLDTSTTAPSKDDVNPSECSTMMNVIPQDTNTMDDSTLVNQNLKSETLPCDSQNTATTDLPLISPPEAVAPKLSSSSCITEWNHTDDPRNMWTAEEDLRLLDAIQSLGVGNWEEISEAVCSGFSSIPPLLSHAMSSTSLNTSTHTTSSSAGNVSSFTKTAKKCMERYLDDYLGRYGHIVPPFLFEEVVEEEKESFPIDSDAAVHSSILPISTSKLDNASLSESRADVAPTTVTDDAIMTNPSLVTTTNIVKGTSTDNRQSTQGSSISTRKRKRIEDSSSMDAGTTTTHVNIASQNISSPKRVSSRSQSDNLSPKKGLKSSKILKSLESGLISPSTRMAKPILATPIVVPKKKYRIIPSSSTPGYNSFWPYKFIPPIPGVQVGDEVRRDIAFRAEQVFVKLISNCSSKDEADQVRKQWEETRLNTANGPRVLPFRLDDIKSLPGADLVGYMPRRVDLDVEWDNNAELILAEMEFSPTDSPEDRALKIKVIEIYNARLNERERRKQFLVDRNLLDYKKNQIADQQLPADERDLVNRMRLFARFHSAQEHDTFVENLLKAKQLRKEIAKLQMYRRMGLRSMSEVERWELDIKHRALLSTIDAPSENVDIQSVVAPSHMDSRVLDSTADALDRKQGSFVGASRASGSYKDKSVVDLWKSSSSKSYRSTERSDRTNRQDSTTVDTSMMPKEDPKSSSIELGDKCLDRIDVGSCQGSANRDMVATDENVKVLTDVFEGNQSDAPRYLDDSNLSMKVSHIDNELIPTEQQQVDTEENMNLAEPFDNDKEARSPLHSLLSSKEIELCKRLSLAPSHYIQVKTVLIQESFMNSGFHRPNANADPSSGQNETIVKIDIHKYSNIVEFCMRNGWIAR